MKSTVPELERVDKELLNLLQSSFPLRREPFLVLGERLNISSSDALNRVRSLQSGGIVRSISGIFDPVGLGYRSTLAALHVAPEQLDAAASVVNAHHGVSHNYARDHYFNLWFTLSLPAEESAEETIASLAKHAGAGAHLNLPAIKVFKLRVYFDMTAEGGSPPEGEETSSDCCAQKHDGLTLADKRVVKQLCNDMPLVEMPFDALAQASTLTVDEFLEKAGRLRDRGVMRRFSAVLRHRRAGFTANAMTCWNVPSEAIEKVGATACGHREVSHCYQRPTAPGWPYNLFAMVHGRSPDDCQEVAKAISHETGVTDYTLLYSSKEYKKEKVRYFASIE